MLSLEHLSVIYAQGKKALNEVSFSIRAGEIMGLIGESGSGKSTVAKAIVGIQPIEGGLISYRGKDLSLLCGAERNAVRREIQIIFQDPYGALNPKMTVREAILEPLIIHKALPANASEHVIRLLEKVLLPQEHMLSKTSTLSGGERQRVAIARALSVDPKVLIMDESLASLDIKTQHEIALLIRKLSVDESLAVLFISHDLNIVKRISDKVAVLLNGRLVEWGTTDALFQNPQHPYTRLLFASAPGCDRGRKAREQLLLKESFQKSKQKEGLCPYLGSCPSAISLCSLSDAPIYKMNEGHAVRCFLSGQETQ